MNRTEWLARCRAKTKNRLPSEVTLAMLAEDAERTDSLAEAYAEWIPTEDEIAERAAAIRANWTPIERRRRRVTRGRNEIFPWYHTRRDCTYSSTEGGTGGDRSDLAEVWEDA